MKYLLNDEKTLQEPIINIKLRTNEDGSVSVLGNKQGSDINWIISVLSKDGAFQPNSEGIRQLGLKTDNTYYKDKQ